MAYLLLGFALLAGLLLAGRWFVGADPKAIVTAIKWVLICLIVGVVISFAVSGRIGWAIAALPALIPWLFRMRWAYRAAKTFSRMTGARSGQSSEIKSRHLEMRLDHDSGNLLGRVIAGRHAGRGLADLSLPELQNLMSDYMAEDEESVRLLAAYLDRQHPDWRQGSGTSGNEDAGARAGSGGRSSGMGRDEALKVLGLETGATADDIRDAHRRLIGGLHPDRGGSAYLSAKINEARDVLLD